MTPSDNASQIAAPSLDAAICEIWPYLTAGASLHFPGPDVCRTARPLREWLVNEYITMAFAPSALVEQLIALEWPSMTALRILLTSGVLRNCPPAGLPFTLVNTYGTAETAVVATSGPVPPQAALEVPPIGRPIDNVSLAILDESMQPVPSGKPGELYIGGPGIARGYVNQPDLTARKFVRDPHSPDPQARLYRTGDLARRLADGQIALLGRLDDRITMRGFRVEPSEIESALNMHPEIAHSVVIAREHQRGEPRLVAYVAPAAGIAAGTAPSAATLEDWLRERLPEYMLPSAIVVLGELPLTRDGKVDRVALPAPQPESEPDWRAELVEARLAQLMASLLEVDEISPEADFFQAGGHPLMAAVVLDRVRQVFGVTLTPGSVFRGSHCLGNRRRDRAGRPGSVPELTGQSQLTSVGRAIGFGGLPSGTTASADDIKRSSAPRRHANGSVVDS